MALYSTPHNRSYAGGVKESFMAWNKTRTLCHLRRTTYLTNRSTKEDAEREVGRVCCTYDPVVLAEKKGMHRSTGILRFEKAFWGLRLGCQHGSRFIEFCVGGVDDMCNLPSISSAIFPFSNVATHGVSTIMF